MKVEWGSKAVSPLILNTGTREVSDLHTPALYPQERIPRTMEKQNVWESQLDWAVLQKRKCLADARIQNPDRPAHS